MGNVGICSGGMPMVGYCNGIQRSVPVVHTLCGQEEEGSGPNLFGPSAAESYPVYQAEAISDEADGGASCITTSSASSSAGKESSRGSLASESTADSSTPPEVNQAQHVVKNFVRGLVKGRALSVLSVNGGLTEIVVSVDRKLTTLSIARSGKKDAKKRGIPMESIAEICVGNDVGDEVELPIDELCVTLLLEDGNAVGFRFGDHEERDTFALCLSMFVDGRRGEVARKLAEKV